MGPAPIEKPITLNCPRCGQPMTFHADRAEPDEHGQTDHIRVYFCSQHGFFHDDSDRKQLTPGLA